MIKKYLKTAIRNIRKRPLSSIINITGFAIGIACVVIISLWIQNQLSYDKFHSNCNNIYRITQHGETNLGDNHTIHVPTAFAPQFTEEFPEVLNSVRFFQHNESAFKYKENRSYESNGYFSDNAVFEIFDFPVINGDPNEALTKPYTITLSKSMAEKYFGNENPIGKSIEIENTQFTVTAIFKDIPENSHLQLDFLVSIPTITSYWPGFIDWESNRVFAYLLLRENANISSLESKMNKLVSEHTSIWDDMAFITKLQPFNNVYLDYRYQKALMLKNGDKRYLYIFIFVGLAILFISCINYINLFKAQNLGRNKEIGIVKVMGASGRNITLQFVFETFIHLIIATIVAGFLFAILFPVINGIIDNAITFGKEQVKMISVLLLLLITICVMAGIIPSLSFTRFKPAAILQKRIYNRSKPADYKSGLVVFQFSISIILLIATLIALKQKNYLMHKNLGFDKEHVLYIPMQTSLQGKFNSFKQELLKHPEITGVSAKIGKPNDWYDGGYFWTTGMTYDEGPIAERIRVDYDYFETLDVDLIQGRIFSRDFADDNINACILNQKAVKEIGFDDPIGKEIYFNEERRIVVGVVENILTKSLKGEVVPEIYLLKISDWWSGSIILVKVLGNVSESINVIKTTLNEFNPGEPFKYQFLDEVYAQLYNEEQKLSALFKLFSIIAIVLACMGIFGLAYYDTQDRIKEIGIRKVNGAKVTEVMAMLNSNFIKWVVMAFVISTPVAWVTMHKWLENFAYKINLSWWLFAFAGIIALGIALITISWQSWRAATRNPVEALRYE